MFAAVAQGRLSCSGQRSGGTTSPRNLRDHRTDGHEGVVVQFRLAEQWGCLAIMRSCSWNKWVRARLRAECRLLDSECGKALPAFNERLPLLLRRLNKARRLDDPAGDHGILVKCVNRAEPVIAIGDNQPAMISIPTEQERRQRFIDDDLSSILFYVTVANPQQR